MHRSGRRDEGSRQALGGARVPDVMPGIVDRLAAAETAVMLADDCALLADHNAIGGLRPIKCTL
jgi:hypothetical protein